MSEHKWINRGREKQAEVHLLDISALETMHGCRLRSKVSRKGLKTRIKESKARECIHVQSDL